MAFTIDKGIWGYLLNLCKAYVDREYNSVCGNAQAPLRIKTLSRVDRDKLALWPYTLINKSFNQYGDSLSNGFRWKSYIDLAF